MANETDELRRKLVALEQQLAAAPEISPELRSRLGTLLGDIERTVQSPGATRQTASTVAGARSDSLVTRLKQATREFEDTHPTLVATIGSVVDALGQMGI